eukprot:CAMPEP_0202353332 /NCGR_PEP_ID=MMETSP1126-20121109/9141_1 /ASSEMBLY_ACC=CAM_ASM_000457 /TAXON_ID=3047 /ORGANISM="Dunaliella tertiolecta, Strain CCMP1320" /LENGTH=85 /DNA_ID=CAMNT_0048945671 /DNA_START=59 /DNA_END=316 /DNA_ORIENTATION=+
MRTPQANSSQHAIEIKTSRQGSSGNKPTFSIREEQKKTTFNESLLVALGVIVFLAVVWLYAVHRLYIDHIENPLLPDAKVLDMSG